MPRGGHAFSIEEPHYLENHQGVPDLPAETGETDDAGDGIIDHPFDRASATVALPVSPQA
jgi:hypothetical protein